MEVLCLLSVSTAHSGAYLFYWEHSLFLSQCLSASSPTMPSENSSRLQTTKTEQRTSTFDFINTSNGTVFRNASVDGPAFRYTFRELTLPLEVSTQVIKAPAGRKILIWALEQSTCIARYRKLHLNMILPLPLYRPHAEGFGIRTARHKRYTPLRLEIQRICTQLLQYGVDDRRSSSNKRTLEGLVESGKYETVQPTQF